MPKAWPPGDTHGRPVKRLFTPEIKRLLKDWLVRRRDNPYPNREEKKLLAIETGLTYTQICNWFANWRRKLKNSGNDPLRKTWGNLIRHYNTNARGNVEQFSICSSDSIWSGADGDDSNDSRHTPPASATGRPEHVVMRHASRQYGTHAPCRMPFSYVKYGSQTDSGDAYNEIAYGETHLLGHSKNTSASYRSKNGRKCAEYVRRLPTEYSTSPTSSVNAYHGQHDESSPSYDGVRARYCFDHCYTPRNYGTVFGIPEDTRCYKIEAGHKYIPAGSHAKLEPLILTTTPSGFGRFEHGNERTVVAGTTTATLFLAQSPNISPTTTTTTGTALPAPAQNRSSKYKSSMMEKYLRDLSELEADHSRQPVIMATIPFQRSYHHHHHLCHRASLDEEPDHRTDPYRVEPALVQAIMDSGDRLSCDTGVLDAPPPSLSKWLESAAKFTPAKHNYIGDWEKSGKQSTAKKRCDSAGGALFASLSGHPGQATNGISLDNALGATGSVILTHQKDEIDAAEALTRLANNFRTKVSS
ncbi:uncharacterized protein LOC125959518 [Anopheles darlingi]|uniref:uncharacterized protein LOC125959518 n=1 Tax=Anopheles darlingi TaxID=43151 RepID=UPI0020FFFD6B|nr:uncharacterized protein LOC125959518 [Anopheles darlingi]